MRKTVLVFLLLVIAIFVSGGLYFYTQVFLGVCRKNCSLQVFVVPQGTSLNEVLEKLEKEKIIKNAFLAKIYLKLSNFSGQIQAGDFKLNPQNNLPKIMVTMQKGTLDFWVTIPEGWRAEQVYERIQKERNIVIANPSVASGEAVFPETEGNKIATSAPAVPPRNDKGLEIYKQNEGYLFPDTYLIPKNASDEDVTSIMKNNFNVKIEIEKPAPTTKIKINNGDEIILHDLIILASLVEREAKNDSERQEIANIIYKRLKADWPLQVDATVQYAIGKSGAWWPKVLLDDLKIESVFNTYLHKGLPPSPICNPGLKAISAVINVSQTENWFYTTGTDGVTRFTKTLDEHNQNVKRYIKP